MSNAALQGVVTSYTVAPSSSMSQEDARRKRKAEQALVSASIARMTPDEMRNTIEELSSKLSKATRQNCKERSTVRRQRKQLITKQQRIDALEQAQMVHLVPG